MRIAVCIKQVPSTNKVQLHPETNTIIRDGRQSVTNPFDTYAIEQAVQLKESQGGEVIALSMGIPATERLLRDAASRGVDRAMLLSDRSFAGADTLATSYTLSLAIRQMGEVDLVLCGKMAVDGDTAQIGPELAETLNIPHVTDVCRILDVSKNGITCLSVTDTGRRRMHVRLPALLTVEKDINMPRMPSIQGVFEALEKPVAVVGQTSLGADPRRCGLKGSPTQVVKTFVPQRKEEAISIEGDEAQQAERLFRIIGEVTDDGRLDHS